jgi:hypothetical protein
VDQKRIIPKWGFAFPPRLRKARCTSSSTVGIAFFYASNLPTAIVLGDRHSCRGDMNHTHWQAEWFSNSRAAINELLILANLQLRFSPDYSSA